MGLFEDHVSLARGLAGKWHLPGGDADDLRQEALIGLWQATTTWNGEGEFSGWAGFVIRRRLLDAVVAANRLKAGPLTGSVRRLVVEEGEIDAVDALVDPRSTEEILAGRDEFRGIVAGIGRLTALERGALVGVVFEGRPYREIGEFKSVDNALSRSRAKLRAAA